MQDRDGKTALMFALKYKPSNEIVNMLIDKTTNFDLQDSYEKTVLMYALQYRL